MNQIYENTRGRCAEGLQQTIWRNLPYKRISPYLPSDLESNWCPEAPSMTLLPEILVKKFLCCPYGILAMPTFWISVILVGAFQLRTFFNAMILPSKPLFRERFLIHILCITHSVKTIFTPFGLTHLLIQQHGGAGQNWTRILVCNPLCSPLMQDEPSPSS